MRLAVGLGAALVVAAVAVITTRGAAGPDRTEPDAWVERTGDLLARSLVVTSPPRLVVPPGRTDLYQTAQAVTALADFGELTDRDWTTFTRRVAADLDGQLRDGYAGPLALAAQLVRASEAAGRPYDAPVHDSLLGLAQRAPGTDVYDQVSAAVLQQWAAGKGDPVPGALSRRDVLAAVKETGCRGDEALFLQAALVRVHARETGCVAAQRDALATAGLARLASAEPAEELTGDRALVVRAVGFLARTPELRAEVGQLRSRYVGQLNAGQVADPLTAAYALGEAPGDGTISPELAAYLRSVLDMGGAPVAQRLSPSAAAVVARTLALTDRTVPGGLLAGATAADLPAEVRARVLLARAAPAAEAERLLATAEQPTAAGTSVTALFQLLVRTGSPTCDRWAEVARRVSQDVRSTLVDRSLATRFLRDCGQDDPAGADLRTAWDDLEEADIRDSFARQSVTCALGFGTLRPPEETWRQWSSDVERSGGVDDESGELDVARTQMMVTMLSDQDAVCRDGVYG